MSSLTWSTVRAGDPPAGHASSAASAALISYRVVAGAMMISLLWKAKYYPVIFQWYGQLALDDPFFPSILRTQWLLATLMLAPLFAGLAVLVWDRSWLLIVHAWTCVICMAGLNWHQGTYNDATFVTCFWTSLWCAWLAAVQHRPVQQWMPLAGRFATLIVSMMLLGGAVGKLTPGFWSGEVLYQIYFVDRDFWFFNWLRETLSESQLRHFATAYSRMVVITELAGAGLWLLPVRWASLLAGLMLSGIVLFSNFNLVSVMACLLGLCLVGWWSGSQAFGRAAVNSGAPSVEGRSTPL